MNTTFSGLPFQIQTAATSKVIFSATFVVPKHLSKKNSNRVKFKPAFGGGTRRATIELSDDAKALENNLILNFRQAAVKFEIEKPLDGSLWMLCRFHYKVNKDGSPCRRVSDLTNLLQGPEDALQKAGIITNDKNIMSVDGSRIINDSGETRLELYLLEY